MGKNKNFKMADDIIEVYKTRAVFNRLASNANYYPYDASFCIIADELEDRGEDFDHDRYKDEV